MLVRRSRLRPVRLVARSDTSHLTGPIYLKVFICASVNLLSSTLSPTLPSTVDQGQEVLRGDSEKCHDSWLTPSPTTSRAAVAASAPSQTTRRTAAVSKCAESRWTVVIKARAKCSSNITKEEVILSDQQRVLDE